MDEDFLKELGFLSFVTRLKRLSDAMIHDGRKMYKELGMDIEPNWFTIFKLLQKYDEQTVTEIADKIGFAHTSVISIVNKMIKAGYLEEKKSASDNRKRILVLTKKAKSKLPEFEKVWDAGTSGVKKMVSELDALNFLESVENKVMAKGFRNRTFDELKLQKAVKIIPFEKKYTKVFAQLNYEWIEKLFRIEEHDREILENPIEYIMKPGGQIFVALIENEPVGTVALIKEGNSFELAKMGVTSKYQGLKIGEKLMKACLEFTKEVGIKRVFLLSNRKLFPAITLYKKFGFKEIPLDPGNLYERADIQMELILE
ncbi:MAG: helix-turn-helix domain-containing GNAT family N-acetyltransferase [Pyrinomonadaceae bacterium]|nr:helix-turn-helix domain-containing GNAT family N-acetyltransferase [Pyrinomonadaceae bacterium]